MAITYVPRRPDNSANLIMSGIQLASNIQQGGEKLAETKKSGKANRAYQEAIGGQAEAASEQTRMQNKVFAANPELYKKLLFQNNKAMLNQLKLQEATIGNMKQQFQFQELQFNAKSVRDKNEAQATLLKSKAADAQVMNALDVNMKKLQGQLAGIDVQNKLKAQRETDFKSIIKDMDVSGQNAARSAFIEGKTVEEIGKIGQEADEVSRSNVKEQDRRDRIAVKLGTTESLEKTPREIKVEKKKTGTETYERRELARENFKLPVHAIDITYDTTPGKGWKNIGGKVTKDLDYAEAKKLGLEGQWIKEYERITGEPYDISKEKEEEQPPANLKANALKKYPKATFKKNKDGEWEVIPNE